MTVLDRDSPDDISRLWALITELNGQLNENRALAVNLYAQAANTKNQAVHTQTGFVLRRFNLDKTQAEYDAELERMNATMAAENQALLNDNKQLNTLIKEYEQTLDTLMSNFRNRAQDVQERELTLIRDYETKLLAREEENAERELAASTAVSEAFERISNHLRQLLHLQNGEDVEPPPAPPLAPGLVADGEEDPAQRASEYALEREIELARLERENEELRRMAGLLPAPRKEMTAAFEVAPLQRFPMGRPSSQSRVGPSLLESHSPGSGPGPAFPQMKRTRTPD